MSKPNLKAWATAAGDHSNVYLVQTGAGAPYPAPGDHLSAENPGDGARLVGSFITVLASSDALTANGQEYCEEHGIGKDADSLRKWASLPEVSQTGRHFGLTS